VKRPSVLICGPSLAAISGVTTHVASLLGSRLKDRYGLAHFQVGSEGRSESRMERVFRLFTGPLDLFMRVLRGEADIVHINTSLNAKSWWRDFLLMTAAKLAGARVVLQKHGGQIERFASNPPFAFFLKCALRIPDAIVVLSRAEFDTWQAFVPKQRIAVLPNGIDPGQYIKKSAPGADLKVVYIGRLAPAKGLDESIEAFSQLKMKLLIAGSGPEKERLKASKNVEFLGPVFGQDKLRLLRSADVLLLPSYSEGLPYSLLEAMAQGVVPVVTPVGAIPDVVIEGVHGRFVPVRNAKAIAEVLSELDRDRARLTRMSEACRRRIVASYSLERLADDFDRLYAALIPWPASQAG
jgi:glycosyltransferase involved in cell wall biosynthesis